MSEPMPGFDRAQRAYENMEPPTGDGCDGCTDNGCEECGGCEDMHCAEYRNDVEVDAYWDRMQDEMTERRLFGDD